MTKKYLRFALCAAPAMISWPGAALASDAQGEAEPSASQQTTAPSEKLAVKDRGPRATTDERRVLAENGVSCIYDNGPPNGANGYSNGTVNAFGARRTLLDDFTVPAGETWSVEDFHWRSVWSTPGAGTFGISLDLSFRSDAAGTPGAPITGPVNVTSYSEVDTGNVVFSREEHEHWASFDPVVLGPGTYWFEGTVVGPENNFWLTAAQQGNECWTNYDDDQGLLSGTARFGVASDLNWCLTGTVDGGDTGACCVGPQCIEMITRGDCILLRGEYSGDGTNCDEVQCGFGACCFFGQCIENVRSQDCGIEGGIYLGDGSDCVGVNCDELGACCLPSIETDKGSVLPDPSCCITTRELCETQKDGIFLGEGVPCATLILQPIHEGPRQDWSHIIRVESNCPEPPGSDFAGNDCVDGPYHVDPWITSGSLTHNCHDFSIVCPLPADFLAPGSDPVIDVVCFKGEAIGDINLPGFGVLNFGEADTLVRREFDPFDACDEPGGGSVDVPIELIALNLVSSEPLIVTFNGGQDPEEWDARITVDPVEQPGGTLTATKEHANGGTFDSDLDVCPTFTFRRRSDGRTIELDYCASCDPGGIPMTTTDSPWVTFIRGNVNVAPNPVCTDFRPGLADGEPSLDGDCNGNGVFDGNYNPCAADNDCDECGDLDGDGRVRTEDLIRVLANWGTAGPSGDTNCDDIVNFEDILNVLGNWTPTP